MLVRLWRPFLSVFNRTLVSLVRGYTRRDSAAILQPRRSGEDVSKRVNCSSDELCDELLCHMLECECCLNPVVGSCPVYRDFQTLIGLNTSAAGPALYAV